MLAKEQLELALSVVKRSLLPEVYEEVGYEATMRFVEIFGGTSLRVPTMSELERAVRDVDIYETMRRNTRSVSKLASKYKIPSDRVEQIYDRLKSTVAQEVRTLPPGVVRQPRLAPGVARIVRKPRLGYSDSSAI